MILLHRMREPETYPPEAADRCPEILATWIAHSPASRPEHRDFEDWAENAHALHELALRGPVTMMPPPPGGSMLGDRTPMISSIDGAPSAIGHGFFSWSDGIRTMPVHASLLGNNADAVRRVTSYASSPVFLAHAGRAMHVVDMDMGKIDRVLRELHGAGRREIFIKSRAKGFAAVVPLGDDASRLWRDCVAAIDALEWMPISHEGDKGALIVQEAFSPTCEYRVIVVGDRPVVGAGCIESHTPVDAEGFDFDDRMEVVRGDGKTVRDADLAARYRTFAETFATEWAHAHGSDMAYSLDLAVDARDGRIKPIELNPFMNLGLYANPLGPVFDAMIERLA